MDALRRAVALARAGRWDEAHALVQSDEGPLACWIHGVLHRIEGDEGNARYWYERAGQAFVARSIDEEWTRIEGLLA